MDRDSDVRENIAKLPQMSCKELVALWEKSFGTPPTRKVRPELMRPVLAYRLQELVYGSLPADTLRSLRHVSESFRPESRFPGEARSRFKPGTRIIREWKGKTYEVLISSDGYQYQGKTYRSLSPIAAEITGTKWSGPAFFGTKRREMAQ